MSAEQHFAITSPHEHLVTAREALEPLYQRFEVQTDRTLLAAAIDAGWSADDSAKALAVLRLEDALAVLRDTH
jgi:hypothetical protein